MPSHHFSVALLFLVLAPPVFADGPDSSPADLVRQLGDPSYRARELAQKELIRRGAIAIADVKLGATDGDLEIKRRCQTILDEIAKSPMDVLLEKFLAGRPDAEAKFPGWDVLKKAMGDDGVSRYLYAQLYKHDPKFLETLESDPKLLAGQFESRFQKAMPLTLAMRKKMDGPPAPLVFEDVAIVLVIATSDRIGIDANATARLYNILVQQSIQQTVRWSAGTRRLIEKWIEVRCDDATYSYQAFNLARTYGCVDLIETKLRPATAKLIDAAAADLTGTAQFYRALNQARQLNMMDLVEQKIRPALRKSIEAAVKEPINVNRLNQLSNCMQSIGGLDEELKPTLRPALTELIKKQAQQMNDMSQFYTIINLARASQNADLIEDYLRPVYRANLLKITAQPKELSPLTNAYYQAQNLGMQDEIEAILRPAAIGLIQSFSAAKDDPNKLQQCLTAAQVFQLKEAIRPTAKELVDDIDRKPPDLQRLNLILQFARYAELPDLNQVIEGKLKPAAQKAFTAAKDLPINAVTVSQSLSLAEQFQLKDGVELALKAAQSSAIPAYSRSQAIFHIARNGSKDVLPQLEKLLDEKADLSSSTINGSTIRAQLGDVALAAAISLSGQKLDDYNFPWPRAVGLAGNQFLQAAPICYGFESDAARAAALKKFRESRTLPKN